MNFKFFEIIKQFALVNGSKFAGLTYRAKETKELARHTILLGVNIVKAYKRDLAVMRRQLPRCKTALETQACTEIIESLEDSVKNGIGNNEAYTCKDVYQTVMPGMKIHKENGTLYVTGFSRAKVVLEEGEYKTVNSKPLTLAKNELRRRMKINRFRQFALQDNVLNSMRINGQTVEIN